MVHSLTQSFPCIGQITDRVQKKQKPALFFMLTILFHQRFALSMGKGDERPFISKILSSGQTGIMDRYYQCHKDFDLWQTEEKHFVCRIKENTHKSVIKTNLSSHGASSFMMPLPCLEHPG